MLGKIKHFFKSFLEIVIAFNKARAASILARQGHHVAAKKIMLEN